jgi:hypothetical protein
LTAIITCILHDMNFICIIDMNLVLLLIKDEVRLIGTRSKYHDTNPIQPATFDQNERSTCTRRGFARKVCIFMTGIRTICIKGHSVASPNDLSSAALALTKVVSHIRVSQSKNSRWPPNRRAQSKTNSQHQTTTIKKRRRKLVSCEKRKIRKSKDK